MKILVDSDVYKRQIEVQERVTFITLIQADPQPLIRTGELSVKGKLRRVERARSL